MNPAGFPLGNSEQESSVGALERVRYHLAPFRCMSAARASHPAGPQGTREGQCLAEESSLPCAPELLPLPEEGGATSDTSRRQVREGRK